MASNDLYTQLRTTFGFAEFRPGQVEAIQSLLDGQDTLVVMPTGSGKSLIYQLSATKFPGLTLVISPLIALMKDQVDSLERHGIPATFINSAIPTGEQNQRIKRMAQCEYCLVYIAPERLRSAKFRDALRQCEISLLAVDESHCVSEWGHDFRPDYLNIASFRASMSSPLTAALTATATPRVQEDIIKLLELRSSRRIVTGFNRPNLTFDVQYTHELASKFKALRKLIAANDNGGMIIYTGTRRDAEEIAEFAHQVICVQADYYHAGLASDERTRIQEKFITGKSPIVVATNAFGMGIDRPDVRHVVHFCMPGTLEAYYQEAGRAGRDGLPAKAVMLYSSKDRALQEWFIEDSLITRNHLNTLYQALPHGKSKLWVTSEELSRQTGLSETKVSVGLGELERARTIFRLGDDGIRMMLQRGEWDENKIQSAATQVKARSQQRKIQLMRMIAYAESNACRRRILLDHFGDRSPVEAIECCDNCLTREQFPPQKEIEAKTAPSSQVHAEDIPEIELAPKIALIILDTIRRLKTKIGREKLAQILNGSRAKDVQRFHYDRNVYYGRLSGLRQSEIKALVEQLIELSYLKVIGGNYPVLSLTPQGEEAIRMKTEIRLELPRSAFVVPTSPTEAGHLTADTFELTAQLFAKGHTPEEIASLRGRSLSTIYNHLSRWVAAGKIDVEDVVPDILRQHVESAIEIVGATHPIASIKNQLPDEINYNLIRCVVEGWKLKQKTTGGAPGVTDEDDKIIESILEFVHASPGQLPRSGAAKLLVGSHSERIEQYRSHHMFKRLANRYRSEVMLQIDSLLISGRLAKDERGCLVPGEKPDVGDVERSKYLDQKDTMDVESSSKSKNEELSNDQIVNDFLSRSHPRSLPGPWSVGWALDFHSRFDGTEWKRSAVGELAYRLKYQGDLTALPALVEQTLALSSDHQELCEVDAIIPVPPSTPRPFDPVRAFTAALAERLGLPVTATVVKKRTTQLQKELRTLAQKRANVKGAFSLQGNVRGKRLLIVDDLFDSGATMEEITHLLQHSGAAKVSVLALTRTIHSDA